jgi:hypothetical protein
MKHSISLFSPLLTILSLVFLLVTNQSNAQVLFRAFHETQPPIPNKSVENADEWNKNVLTKGANVFQVAAGKLVQSGNECAATSKTPFPGVDGTNWTDYTVVFDVWWKDDDGLGIIFRYTNDTSYYCFITGGTDGHYSNNWFIGKDIFKEKVCFLDAGGAPIKKGPTGLNVDNSGPYTMMIQVKGSKIEGFFGKQIPQKDILAGKTPPKMGEVDDNSFKKGAAGIGTSTCPSEFANIQVFGPGGPLAVNVRDKLATFWSTMKVR